MSDEDTLNSLITDLRKIRDVCNTTKPGVYLSVARDYLVANYDLIDFYLKQVYIKLSEAQRNELQSNHRELDYSAVGEDWYRVAMAAPRLAKEARTWPAEFLDDWVDEDDINCLLRGLLFVKYCPIDKHNYVLQLSPIDQYGLERYGHKRYNLNDEERNELKIPWHISDILYADRERKAIAECIDLGVDLKSPTRLLPARTEDWNKAVEIIIHLLDEKLDYDLAVVYTTFPNYSDKFINEILSRWSSAYGNFLTALHMRWFFYGYGKPAQEKYTEYKKTVWDKILDIRPKPETFQLVRRMIKDKNITEVVMGDKITIGDIGGSAIINIKSALKDVTQTINSSKNLDEADKKQLADLIEQLKAELQKAPAENAEEAETIAEYAKNLVEAGAKEKPNRTTLKITAEGLKKAAENIAGVVPSVLGIASSIIKFVFQISGVPLP